MEAFVSPFSHIVCLERALQKCIDIKFNADDVLKHFQLKESCLALLLSSSEVGVHLNIKLFFCLESVESVFDSVTFWGLTTYRGWRLYPDISHKQQLLRFAPAEFILGVDNTRNDTRFERFWWNNESSIKLKHSQ